MDRMSVLPFAAASGALSIIEVSSLHFNGYIKPYSSLYVSYAYSYVHTKLAIL